MIKYLIHHNYRYKIQPVSAALCVPPLLLQSKVNRFVSFNFYNRVPAFPSHVTHFNYAPSFNNSTLNSVYFSPHQKSQIETSRQN